MDKYFTDKKTGKIVYKNDLGRFITHMSPANFPLSQLDQITDNELLFKVLSEQQVNFNDMTKLQQSVFLDGIGLEN